MSDTLPPKGYCPDCDLEGDIDLFATMSSARLLHDQNVGLGTCKECYENQ